MSSFGYGAIVAKREAAPAGESTTTKPPGVGSYLDALAALVPAEVIALHAIIISFCTKTKEGTPPVTEITERTTLKWAFVALAVLAPVLFLAGRAVSKTKNVVAPSKVMLGLQALIPAAAFVAWTMLLKTSAFDAIAPHLATGARETIAVIGAVVLGTLAAALGYKLNEADKQVKPPARGGGAGGGGGR
jgi:hypothetical protein